VLVRNIPDSVFRLVYFKADNGP